MRLAVACCQNYEHGYFTAFRHLSQEDLDLVLHLGDYIYEASDWAESGNPRRHAGDVAVDLADYRRRYAQYKMDADLQAAHAAFPWVVTWDDHEVSDNYAAGSPDANQPSGNFAQRRAAAYKAYWEHLPLRTPPPRGASLGLYRRLRFGNLVELNVLDTRQYRTPQPCGDRFGADCPGRTAPGQDLMGHEQERWLLDGLGRSSSTWNVIAQQVVMAQIDVASGARRGYDLDAWDGYVAARDRLLAFLAQRRPSNPVVLSGDWHSNWMADLKADFRDPNSPTLAHEFVASSITSGGDGSDSTQAGRRRLGENPHLRFFNDQRGYLCCEITDRRWQTDVRVMPYVHRPGAPVSTRTSFVLESGAPEVQQAY